MSRAWVAAAVLVGLLGLYAGFGAGLVAERPAAATSWPLEARLAGDIRERLNASLSAAEASRIARAVLHYSSKYELDADLVMAILEVESSARVGARSPKGALGLMQVMPHMAAALDLAGNHTTVETNIEAGCLILAHNISRLGEEDGVSAYFWGSEIRGVSYLNRVRAARSRYRRLLAP